MGTFDQRSATGDGSSRCSSEMLAELVAFAGIELVKVLVG